MLISLKKMLGKAAPEHSEGFRQLLTEHACMGMLKQIVLVQRVPGDISRWQCDMDRGMLTLGDGFKVRLQLIGSSNDTQNGWLWPWANRLLGPPAKFQKDALQLKHLGEELNIPELSSKELLFDNIVQAEPLVLIAAGVCGRNGILRTVSTLAYGTVYSWFTLTDIAPLSPAECHAENIIAAINRAAAYRSVNQVMMVRYFFDQLGLVINDSKDNLSVELTSGELLVLKFDRFDRINDLWLDGNSLLV